MYIYVFTYFDRFYNLLERDRPYNFYFRPSSTQRAKFDYFQNPFLQVISQLKKLRLRKYDSINFL